MVIIVAQLNPVILNILLHVSFISQFSSSFFFFNFLSILVKKNPNGIICHQNNEGQKEDLELPFLDLSTIVRATDNFAHNKKLGEGGFGPVYKVNL